MHAIGWLGFQINLGSGTSVKIEALRAAVNNMIRLTSRVPARQLASVIGKINAISLGLGPITRLMTHLYSNLNKRHILVPEVMPDWGSLTRIGVLGPSVSQF